MKVRCEKIPAEIVKQNRNFYKNRVKRAFVAWCAYEGKFDGILTKEEIERAKRGDLPKDLNVHHIVPLSVSNDLFVNDFCNLAVIHKKTHEFINKHVFAPQLKGFYNAPTGTVIEIDVPKYDYVDTQGIKQERTRIRDMFFKRNGCER